MNEIKKALIACASALLCICLFACNTDNSSGGGNGTFTEFKAAEALRFQSEFGFVIPFVETSRYQVDKYDGYNGDLRAEEHGLAFVAELSDEEDCRGYLRLLEDDECYSYEYRDGGYYYFSRDGYFVKCAYNSEGDLYKLEVYVYSYRFDEGGSDSSDDSSDAPSDGGDSSDSQRPEYGFEYEENGDSSYSIIGFFGDEDGVVEIPDYYNGLPVRYIRGNAFYGRDDITEVIVGNNVYSIEGNAFMHCRNLRSVTLGGGIALIDMQAFLGCGQIREITIPASVTFIGHGAFRDCYGLDSVILEDPQGWYTSSDIYNRPYPVEEMSDAQTVAEYFTDRYVSTSWMK